MTALVQVIVGTTRQGRFADRPAAWIADLIDRHEGLKSEVVDLRDHPLELFDRERAPAATGREHPSEASAEWARRIDGADGYVIVTGEYNHGYPAVLKNALDHAFVEWRRKPVSFVGYGGAGGARVVEQLRLVAVELDLAPMRLAVHLTPDVLRAVRESPDDQVAAAFEPVRPRAEQMVDDLAWWCATLAAGREPARAG